MPHRGHWRHTNAEDKVIPMVDRNTEAFCQQCKLNAIERTIGLQHKSHIFGKCKLRNFSIKPNFWVSTPLCEVRRLLQNKITIKIITNQQKLQKQRIKCYKVFSKRQNTKRANKKSIISFLTLPTKRMEHMKKRFTSPDAREIAFTVSLPPDRLSASVSIMRTFDAWHASFWKN